MKKEPKKYSIAWFREVGKAGALAVPPEKRIENGKKGAAKRWNKNRPALTGESEAKNDPQIFMV